METKQKVDERGIVRMPELSTLEPSSLLDQAIGACDVNITAHRKAARATLIVLILMLFVLILAIVSIGVAAATLSSYTYGGEMSQENLSKILESVTNRHTVTTYVLLALCVIVFGVMMAVYRFHLQEIAKAEHYKIGFIRIKIAANHYSEGFESEVREALTRNAFDPQKTSFTGSKGKVESPLPGYPTSDLATLFINKVFDTFEIRAEPKQKE